MFDIFSLDEILYELSDRKDLLKCQHATCFSIVVFDKRGKDEKKRPDNYFYYFRNLDVIRPYNVLLSQGPGCRK